jgi:hypothetical protein
MKAYETANKLRRQAVSVATGGQSGVTDGERIAFLERTILKYESIWSSHKPTSLQPYLDKLNATKTVLESKEERLGAKHADILEALNTAFGPTGFQVTIAAAEAPRSFDGVNTIILSPALAKTLSEKARKEGLLPVVMSETPTILKALAVERDTEGNSALNFQLYFQKVPMMLESILKFCATVPRHKVFKACPETLEATEGATVAAKAPRQPTERAKNTTPRPAGASGPKVGGQFKAGSAMANLYQLLEDQVNKSLADILKALPVSDPMGRVKALQKIGESNGRWTVKMNGGNIQMVVK